jgi:rare lipoprotein A
MYRCLPILLLVAACGSAPTPTQGPATPRASGASAEPTRAVKPGEIRGFATWYGETHHGRQTASGEPFDMYALTAAHKTLPFNTLVRVVDRRSLKTVVVRVNDRGPYRKGRIIDLSFAAAQDLDIVQKGKVTVDLQIVEWGDNRRVHRKYKERYGR